jgi:hypothetical protein
LFIVLIFSISLGSTVKGKMGSDIGRATRTTSSPAPAASSSERTNFAYAKPSLPQSDRYVELEDFYAPSDPAQDARHRSSPPKRRRLYIPNTLWTRSFAITVILETILTVGIERYKHRMRTSFFY